MATEGGPEAVTVELRDVGKRFVRQWVLEGLSATFRPGTTTGVRGSNGSGKSTLLRILAGQLRPSRGTARFLSPTARLLPPGQVYRRVGWTAPYLELPEELTIREYLEFHYGFKGLLAGYDTPGVLERIGLAGVRNRKLVDCSSGMRQRVLLAGALYSRSALLLLDEPSLTLDEASAAWFTDELRAVAPGRTVVVASNDARDLVTCGHTLELPTP